MIYTHNLEELIYWCHQNNGLTLPMTKTINAAATELAELKAMAKQVGEENTNLINTIHAQRVELDETRSAINEALDLLETPEARQGRVVGPAYRKLVDVIRKYPEG